MRWNGAYANPVEDEGWLEVGGMPSLGERVRELRQRRGWSQQQLAEKVGVRQKQISSYERGTNTPSAEILISMAEAVEVSLDFLAQRSSANAPRIAIADLDLLEKLQDVDRLPEEDRTLVKGVIDLVLLKHRVAELAGRGGPALPVPSSGGG